MAKPMTVAEFHSRLASLLAAQGINPGVGDISDIFGDVVDAVSSAASSTGDFLSSAGSGALSLLSSGASGAASLLGTGITAVAGVAPTLINAGVSILNNTQKNQASTLMMQQQLAQRGYSFTSPQATNFLGQVSSQGVIDPATGRYVIPPTYSSGISSYILPLGLAAAGLAAFFLMKKK